MSRVQFTYLTGLDLDLLGLVRDMVRELQCV